MTSAVAHRRSDTTSTSVDADHEQALLLVLNVSRSLVTPEVARRLKKRDTQDFLRRRLESALTCIEQLEEFS